MFYLVPMDVPVPLHRSSPTCVPPGHSTRRNKKHLTTTRGSRMFVRLEPRLHSKAANCGPKEDTENAVCIGTPSTVRNGSRVFPTKRWLNGDARARAEKRNVVANQHRQTVVVPLPLFPGVLSQFGGSVTQVCIQGRNKRSYALQEGCGSLVSRVLSEARKWV